MVFDFGLDASAGIKRRQTPPPEFRWRPHGTTIQTGDALLGVEAIATELFGNLDNLSKEERYKKIRQVNHLLSVGGLPGRKASKFWISSKSRIRQFLAGEVA
jgi:hypothetical protein